MVWLTYQVKTGSISVLCCILFHFQGTAHRSQKVQGKLLGNAVQRDAFWGKLLMASIHLEMVEQYLGDHAQYTCNEKGTKV